MGDNASVQVSNATHDKIWVKIETEKISVRMFTSIQEIQTTNIFLNVAFSITCVQFDIGIDPRMATISFFL